MSSSTRWESSQRPLFVKSVWMNGYRHAILTKEDPVAKRKPSANRLRSSKQNSARSKLKSSNSSDSSDSSSLVIPAVQLLLADVHRLNRVENEKQFPERKKLVKSITFNVISREYSQIHVKNLDLEDFTPSSKHISLSYNLNNSSNKIQVVERIKSERIEQSSSSLTERVLLWLDLAGRFSNEYSLLNNNNNNNNIEDDNKKTRNMRIRENKRVSTAYPSYSEKTAQFSPVNHNNNVFVRKCTKNSHFIASSHDSDIDLSFENEDDYSILKEPRKIQSEEQNVVVQPEPIVTSHIEDTFDKCKSSDTDRDNEHTNRNYSHTQDLSKRQVHIFMPIMKKNIENNSEYLMQMKEVAPNIPVQKLENLLSGVFGILSPEGVGLGLPDFPIDNIIAAAKIMEENPNVSTFNVLYRLYPYRSFLTDGIPSLESLLKNLNVHPEFESSQDSFLNLEVISSKISSIFSTNSPKNTSLINESGYIETNYQNELINEMLQTYPTGDFCLIGPRGCGKNIVVNKLAEMLGKKIESIVLYQDMTSRDLVQQRTTLDNGDTVWRNSPLIDAALDGKIALIDGIHRIHPSTLSVLHRLVHDREIQLHDGKRLISLDRYEYLINKNGITKEQLNASGVLPIHPDFKIIALAEPPQINSKTNWLTSEMLSLFLFHEMRTLSKIEEMDIISRKCGAISKPLHQLIDLAHVLRNSPDPTLQNLSGHLSTRQLLRIAMRMSKYPTDNIYEVIQATFMSKFLPSLTKDALENTVKKLGIEPLKSTRKPSIKYKTENGIFTIGNTSIPIYETKALSKVPHVLFYDVPEHLIMMEKLLQDFQLGSHLLLVGNQGVGKNKIIDRFLNLLNRPREYIQLHRDTTVQTLTTQPTVKDGLLIHEDSPLVKAIKLGHILVIDEADKAPTHVTCILKTLVESGEMILSDGRRIVRPSHIEHYDVSNTIITHPDFRMIILANRPGFPFLGNDFFGALGDLFSCHAVDNPTEDAEIELLKQYGPHVPETAIRKLVSVFDDLRNLADQGLVNYPYSTREVVNIVKHLEKFPEADISEVIFNVFDFDRYSNDIIHTVAEILEKHGFPSKNLLNLEWLAAKRAKEYLQVTVDRKSGLDTSSPKHGKEDPNNDPHVGGNTWAGGTGGRDTAGLGGKGGPYRLDKGHKIHQLSDEEKNAVPEHIKKATREMGRKAFEEKLKEIGMSGYDASLYGQFSNSVQRQVQSLRVILGSLQAKNKERHWSRHQTSGELDDVKLIDGLLGEKTVYRRRTEQEPELGAPQMKPKRLRLVVDVSGSMYRFNSYDGRLDRELEAVVLVMEAFQGFEDKIKYDIMGHSGDAHDIKFVEVNDQPDNNKKRLDVLKLMHAHSQYCWTGDNTLPSTKLAIESLAKEDCDEAIVVVLSDANLQRYGIPPQTLGKILNEHPNVSSYAVFIGSLGDQAERLIQNLPSGRAFVCTDVSNLPQILKQIFSASVMKLN